MGPAPPSKKKADWSLPEGPSGARHIPRKMGRTDPMAKHNHRPCPRKIPAGLGATVLGPAVRGIAAAPTRAFLTLQATSGEIALGPQQADTAIWSLQSSPLQPQFRRGDELEITVRR